MDENYKYLGIGSMVCGILGFLTILFDTKISFALCVSAIIMGMIAKKHGEKKYSVAGIIIRCCM